MVVVDIQRFVFRVMNGEIPPRVVVLIKRAWNCNTIRSMEKQSEAFAEFCSCDARFVLRYADIALLVSMHVSLHNVGVPDHHLSRVSDSCSRD